MSLFDRVSTTPVVTERTEVDAKTGKVTAGVFIPLPYNLAKQFPPKPKEEDDSAPHVTLLYIGDVTPEEMTKVVSAVREVAKDWPPFRMDVSTYGEFKNDKEQTIPHMAPAATIRVKGPQGVYYRTLGELHADLFAAVEGCGVKIAHKYGHTKASPSFAKRAETFKSHTTLAYQNKGDGPYTGPKPTGSFQVNDIEVWGWEVYKIPLGNTTADQPTGAPMILRDPKVQTMRNESEVDRVVNAVLEQYGPAIYEQAAAEVTEARTNYARSIATLHEDSNSPSRFLDLAFPKSPVKPKTESETRAESLVDALRAFSEEGGAGNTPPEPGSKPEPNAKEPGSDPDNEPLDRKKKPKDPKDPKDPKAEKPEGEEGEEGEGEEGEEGEEEQQLSPFHQHGHAIIIGTEDKAPITLSPEQIEATQKTAKHGVHFEGQEPEPPVADFIQQNLGNVKPEPWEPEEPKPGDPRWHPHLAHSLFGRDTDEIHHAVTTHDNFDPKKSIHDNLLGTADAWHHPEHGHHVSSHDLNHLVKSVSDDPAAAEVHPGTSEMHKQLHGGMEDFKRFHKAGFAATFPQDSGHHEHHTKIARIADTAHAARDAHLAHMMRTKGGVYFASKEHVPAAAARLARKGSKSAKVDEGSGSLFDRLIGLAEEESPTSIGVGTDEAIEANDDYLHWVNGYGDRSES